MLYSLATEKASLNKLPTNHCYILIHVSFGGKTVGMLGAAVPLRLGLTTLQQQQQQQ
jgi:hypothetical protein